MIATKKFITSVVVITTIFTVLFCTTFTGYAEELTCLDDEEFCVTTADDPNISYDEYLKQFDVSTFGIGRSTALYAFGDAFAAAGAVSSSIPYLGLGLLLFADSSSDFFYMESYETIKERLIPMMDDIADIQEKHETINNIASNLSDETIYYLEDIGINVLEGNPFVVPNSVLHDIARAINYELGLTTDSAGNLIDTSLSIPSTELRVLYTYDSTFKPGTDNKRWIVGERVEGDTSLLTIGQNSYLTWENHLSTDEDISYQVIRNNNTGSVLTFGTGIASASVDNSMSRWYLYTDTDGSQFWLYGDAYGSNNTYTTHSVKSGMTWFEFSSTGTVLDGKRFISATWNASAETWEFATADGAITSFPLDPLGTIISNTGIDTGISDSTGVVVENPSRDEKQPFVGPPVVTLPTTDGGTITTPLTDIKTGTITKTDTDVEIDTETDTGMPKLDSPSELIGFVEGFVDKLAGLFDWLPEDFTFTFEIVLDILQGLILVLLTAKVIDFFNPLS